MAKRAVITGITGQDGSYLAELLLEQGYEVTGVVRRSSSPNLWRIEHLLDRMSLRNADLLDQLSLMRIIADVKPHEFYNLAAMSFVPYRQLQVAPGCFVIRVEGDAAAAREQLRKAVSAAEPTLMFSSWLTIEERVQRWLRNDLAAVRLTAGFSVLATLLAVIGVLGTLGYLVASRSREIAVRLAIGAEPGRVWRELVRDALRLGVAGAGLGLALSLGVLYFLGSKMMSGLQLDWLALGVAVSAGVGAAVIGGLLPARRAAKVDPLALLKAE